MEKGMSRRVAERSVRRLGSKPARESRGRALVTKEERLKI